MSTHFYHRRYYRNAKRPPILRGHQEIVGVRRENDSPVFETVRIDETVREPVEARVEIRACSGLPMN